MFSPRVLTPLAGIRTRAAMFSIQVVNFTISNDVNESLSLVKQADVVIIVAGTTSTENEDRPSLELDDDVDQLIEAVAAVRPTVVLVEAPGAFLTPWRDKVNSLACILLGGEATGAAWAALLFGDASPSGKLPVALPASELDAIAPTTGLLLPYSEELFTSYRSTFSAAFPFGHGISFGTFDYRSPWAILRHPATAPSRTIPGPPGEVVPCHVAAVCASILVVNVGSRPGAEVVQVYIEFPSITGFSLPKFQLRNFQKSKILLPGEQEELNFSLTQRDISVYSPEGLWSPQTIFRLHIGASSADIRHVLSFPLLPEDLIPVSNGTSSTQVSITSAEHTVDNEQFNTILLAVLQPLTLLAVVIGVVVWLRAGQRSLHAARSEEDIPFAISRAELVSSRPSREFFRTGNTMRREFQPL